MGISQADNSVKNWRNLPISNPKPDVHNINAHTKFGENPLMFTCYHLGTKIWACFGQITVSKIDEIRPLAIPNQISTISMHIPSLVKIHWCLLKLSSGNEMDGRTDVRRTDGLTDDQRETMIPRHYCVAGYKKQWRYCWRLHPSICQSGYLPNHWAKFNQTCFMTCPHGKGVWEQHYFSLRASRVSPFICHAISS